MTVLNANEIGYYDLNKKIVECDDNDITITDAMGQRYTMAIPPIPMLRA